MGKGKIQVVLDWPQPMNIK